MSIDPTKTRGYRNNNPGNIDHVPANRWQGLADPPIETAPPGGRARFARFISPAFGIRALAVLLITYQDKHGLRTIRGIVSRWAPGSENNTEAYIGAVARAMDRDARAPLDLHSFEDLRSLVVAIITHEIGGQPYAASVIDEGLRLAGVPRPVTTLAEAARTGSGRGVITGAAVTGSAAVVAQAIEAAPVLSALQGLDWRVGVAVIVVAAAAAIAFVLSRRAKSSP